MMSGDQTDIGVSTPATRESPTPDPPRPAPLLWPAIALAGGIWLSEYAGEIGGSARWLTIALLAAAAIALLFAFRTGRGRAVTTLVLILAFGVGVARHQGVVSHPTHHVVHALGREPLLTRLVGDVVSTPVSEPGQRRNPFLPFDPPGRTRFVVALHEFRTDEAPTPATGRVRVSVAAEHLGLRLGDRVELTGKLFRSRGPQNPGEIDWARWNRLQGIDAGMSVEGPQYVRHIGDDGSWWRRVVAGVRGYAQALLLEPYAHVGADDGSRLLQTMVLGQRGAAGREINEAFLRAGGMHFLAVSGFHVGVLAGAVWWLTRRLLRGSSTIAALTTLFVILLYAIVAEPNAPIMRATIMGVLAMLSVLRRRPFNGMNWLALAAICILAVNPLDLYRPGFQFSVMLIVLMVVGTVVWAYRLVVPWGERVAVHPFYQCAAYAFYRCTVCPAASLSRVNPPPAAVPWWRGIGITHSSREEFSQEASSSPELLVKLLWRGVAGLFVTCVMMWLFGLPLTMLHFERVAVYGWLGTFLLSIPVTLAICLAFLTLIANLLIPPVGAMLTTALAWTIDVVLGLAGLFEHVPGAVVEMPPPPWIAVIAVYVVVLMLVWRNHDWTAPRDRDLLPAKRKRRDSRRLREQAAALATFFASLLLCVVWPFLPSGDEQDDYCIHALSVGNGSATVVTTPNGEAAVFDSGTDRNSDVGETVSRALRAMTVRHLDAVCVSHANFDHYSGVPTLLPRVPADRLWFNPYFESAADHSKAVRLFFKLLPDGADARTQTVCAGDQLSIGEMLVEVLWPPAGLAADTWQPNDRSLVLRLHAGGRTVLVPGDIERDAIRGLLAAEDQGHVRLAADVLIAPHHGSVLKPDTAAFLAAVDPEVVVVSSGTPRSKFVELVRETLGPDVQLVSTRDVGAITIRITPGGDITVETPFAPND